MTLFKAVSYALLVFVALVFVRTSAWAADRSKPVDFQAKTVSYDDKAQTVTATGNVELVQSGRVLKADQIDYNLAEDRVKAKGNVTLMEVNGDVHFADEVELKDEMRNGFVTGLQSSLADGSRFWAKSGKREDANITDMKDAAYTPCEPCKADPTKKPAWQISADKVRHNEKTRRISYRDATFDIVGVPVLYTPYFSHPDGTVKRQSGLLAPSFALDSELGPSVKNRYYIDIAPDKDTTIGLQAFTDRAPLISNEYRQRFENGELELFGSFTYSDYVDSIGDRSRRTDERLRGHLFGDGRWDIDDKWRAGFHSELTSDDQYLRQYKLSSEDVLENEIYTERFSGRDYFVTRALSFQDVRVSDRRGDQPDVLPEIEASFLGEPGEFLGGRWRADFSALGLQRSGNGQDVNRVTSDLGWDDKYITGFGLVTDVSANLRGDVYYLTDVDDPVNDTNLESRFFPTTNITTRYPLARDFSSSQLVIEPLVGVTLIPNLNESKIPNEDSRDVQVDALNLFKDNRFPGFDQVEDQSRATYGVRSGLYDSKGSKFEMFLGQSHRFQKDDTTFPAGSGLNSEQSDYVGLIEALYKDKAGLNYRFQLDNSDFHSVRHEVDAFITGKRVGFYGTYLFADEIEGNQIGFNREQVRGDAYYLFTDNWRFRTGALYNLNGDTGLRRANFGLDYLGQCYSLSTTINRNLTQEQSGDSSTEIIFSVGLKNIGEFATSGLDLTGLTSSTQSEPKTGATSTP